MLGNFEVYLEESELSLSQGVLVFQLAGKSWVLIKQAPNRQLWWSSPLSGPRRYEYMPDIQELTQTRDEERKSSSSNMVKIEAKRLLDSKATRWRWSREPQLDLLSSLRQELLQVTGKDLLLLPPAPR